MWKAISGQVVVPHAGSAVMLHVGTLNEALLVKASPDNTGKVYVGNNGNKTVTSVDGYILAAGDSVAFYQVGRCCDLFVNADTDNSKVCWILMHV